MSSTQTLNWKVIQIFLLQLIQTKAVQIIYTKNTLDVTERLDLNTCHNLYESNWVEIKKYKQ